MPIVIEGAAVPVHSIAFRASSLKRAQELARFAAPAGGAYSPARLICSHARAAKRGADNAKNRRCRGPGGDSG